MVLLAPNLARPRLAAPSGAPTRAAHGMSGFCIRQTKTVWLGRPSGERFKRHFLDAFCWQTVLPDPAPPPRRAPRRDPPVVCPCFGLGQVDSNVQ